MEAGIVFASAADHALIELFDCIKLVIHLALFSLPGVRGAPIRCEQQRDDGRVLRLPLGQAFVYIPGGLFPVDVGEEFAVWSVHASGFVDGLFGGEFFDDLLLAQ